MHRFLLASVLLLGAATLHAQNQLPLDDTVDAGRFHYYLFQLTLPTAEAAVVEVSLDTTSAAGLRGVLEDLDGRATATAWSIGNASRSSAGNITFSISLPARQGVFDLLLAVETSVLPDASDYVGEISTTEGTLAAAGQVDVPVAESRPRILFDRVVEYSRQLSGSSVRRAEFTLDFGGMDQTTTFGFIVVALNLGGGAISAQLADMSPDPPTPLVTIPTVSASSVVTAVPTQSYDGERKFRVEIDPPGGTTFVQWRAYIGPDVALVSARNLGGGSSSDDGGCAIAGAPAVPALALILPALWLLRRRRRS